MTPLTNGDENGLHHLGRTGSTKDNQDNERTNGTIGYRQVDDLERRFGDDVSIEHGGLGKWVQIYHGNKTRNPVAVPIDFLRRRSFSHADEGFENWPRTMVSSSVFNTDTDQVTREGTLHVSDRMI